MRLLLVGLILLYNLALQASTLPGPDAPEQAFSFVVLGDAQFNDPPAFNRIIDQVRRLSPSFVIQVGDLIEGYNSDLQQVEAEWQRFDAQIAPLGEIPFYAVPGNHDVFGSDKRPDTGLERLFEQRWGPLYYSFAYKNALFVTLNSDSSAGINRIDKDQLAWLKETLAASKAQHKFVFLHRPPFLLQNATALHEVFKTHGVEHVFYGHHHHYHFFTRDDVRYTMTNAAGDGITNQPLIGGFDHLLFINVRDHVINTAVIEADSIAPHDLVTPTDNYDYFALHRQLVSETQRMTPTTPSNSSSDNETTPANDPNSRWFSAEITLRNTSEREIQVYVTCDSADQRWQYLPRQIPTQVMGAKTDTVINLALGFALDRQPEAEPVCDFKVPLQTHRGAWLELQRSTRLQR